MLLVYIAILKDKELSASSEILTVQTNFYNLLEYVKEYFGINKFKVYSSKVKYMGYTAIVYKEFEDDLMGYHTFNDEEDGEVYDIYIP